MATRQDAKQKLIDRITTLAGTVTTVEDVNFLSKALSQVGKNPEYKDTSRTSPKDVRHMPQASDTTSIQTDMHNGIHREREVQATGFMADNKNTGEFDSPKEKVNFQISAKNEANMEFSIWGAFSNFVGGNFSYDQHLRPYERRSYRSQGSHWTTGGDGGEAKGVYTSSQKSWGSLNNSCYLNTGGQASSSNTSTSDHLYHYPSRSDNVGEVGHFRIKTGEAEQCRMHDFGNTMKWENIEVGTGQLDHRHSYIKMAGKVISLREKWMPSEYATYTDNQGWASREEFESPSKLDITYGYDATNSQLQQFQPGYGTVSTSKVRQEVVFFNQITDGSSAMIGKVYRHVDRIKRISVLDDICKDVNALYFKFNYGSGFSSSGSDSIEPQKCAKITLCDDGSIFCSMLNTSGSVYALGRLNKSYLTNTTGHVQELVITNRGSGYTTAPTITIADPITGGTTATGTLTITDGRVTGYAITNAGTNYSWLKGDRYGHPLVTVDNTGTNGSGCEIVANVCVDATFENVTTNPTHSTVYGRGTGRFGQRIFLSRDRTKTCHFSSYYGMGCGGVSYLIDRTHNSWSTGWVDTDTSFGIQVVAFRNDQFLFHRGRDWDDKNNHEVHLYYQTADKSTVDAGNYNKTEAWKESSVGRKMDFASFTTVFPTIVPYF